MQILFANGQWLQPSMILLALLIKELICLYFLAEPTEIDFKVLPVNLSCVEVEWSTSNNPNGKITHHQVLRSVFKLLI